MIRATKSGFCTCGVRLTIAGVLLDEMCVADILGAPGSCEGGFVDLKLSSLGNRKHWYVGNELSQLVKHLRFPVKT